MMLNHNIRGVGTFHRCCYFARPLVRNGHRVTVLTNSKGNRLSFVSDAQNEFEIIESPDLLWGQLRSGWDPINVLRRIRHFSKNRFDLIHAFDSRPTVIFPALSLARRWQCPLIMDWCDWWGRGGVASTRKPRWLNQLFEPIETFFEEHFRKYADHITTISEPLRARAIGLGIPEDKVTVISPVADLDEMYPMDKKDARAKLGLPADAKILMFSSFVQYDVDFLMAALKRIWERHPSCILIVTGKKVFDQRMDANSNQVIYAGHVPQEELRSYIGASDLCLLPLSDSVANRARFPDKLRTYLSCGRPVIGTTVGEAKRLLADRNAGLLSRPDVASYSAAILEGIESSEKFEYWNREARKIAETEMSELVSVQKLEAIYKNTEKAANPVAAN